MTIYRSRRRRTYRLRDRTLLVTGLGVVSGVLMHLSNQLAGANAEPPAIEGGLVVQLVGGVAFFWLMWGLVELMAWMDWRAANRSREESERRYGERKIRQAKRPEDVREGLRLIQGGRR